MTGMTRIRDTTLIDCTVFGSKEYDLGKILTFFAKESGHKHIHKKLFTDEEKVPFQQPERNWELWIKRLWKVVNCEYREHIINSSGGKEFVLYGSCPLSLFVNIGQCIGRPTWFVNEFRDTLQYFDLSFKQKPQLLGLPQPDISQFKVFETEITVTDSSITNPTILIFLTTNKLYKLGDKDQQKISELLTERDPTLKIGTLCVIRPKSEMSLILNGQETNDPTDLVEIRQELYDINQHIRYTFCDMRGAILAPAIPSVIALIYGTIWKTNLFGELMVAERIGNEYVTLI